MTIPDNDHDVNLMPEEMLLERIIEKYASRYVPKEEDKVKEKPADVRIWICA